MDNLPRYPNTGQYGVTFEEWRWVMDEFSPVETYSNNEREEASTILVGIDDEKVACEKTRLTVDADWSDWILIGSATDYAYNAYFAKLNGAPFKL